ncbi:MAG: dTDP-4-dehydrorhamnose 3,5-epimerase [Desulfovibrionaceae bacterium]
MRYIQLKIKGAFLLEYERIQDERGSFAREFCKKELNSMGITFDVCQMNISHNNKRGTIRGMHYQIFPYEEQKIVFCSTGSLYDVIVDLRRDSATYLQWIGHTLDPSNNSMLFIPKGCAHGFQTLEDNTTLHYIVDEYYIPSAYAGVRYNDPLLAIDFPIQDGIIISERDATYSDIIA